MTGYEHAMGIVDAMIGLCTCMCPLLCVRVCERVLSLIAFNV